MIAWLVTLGGVYLALLVYATFNARRQNRSADDYALAGSNVGVVLGSLTFAATLFSTFALMGMPDFVRQHGVGAWIFLGVSDAAIGFMVLWFGFHLRRRASEVSYRGIAGLLSHIYRTAWAGHIYFAGVFAFLVPYVAIQVRGIAVFLAATLPTTLPVWGWATIIVVVFLIYSEIGGLKAIIYSDVLQGALLFSASWVIALLCLRRAGGVTGLFERVRAVDEALLSTPGPEGLLTPQFLIASFLALVLIPVTQPQLTNRIIIMRNPRAMRHMAVVLSAFTFFGILPAIAVGMYGAVNHADASMSEFLARVYVFDQAPVIAAAVTVGLIGAAMSTTDSQIFALGTELRSLLKGEERAVLARTKVAIVTFAAMTLTFAIASGDELVLLARVSFAGTALLAPLIFAAVLSSRHLGGGIIIATALGLLSFLLSVVGVLPAHVGWLRVDLALLVILSVVTTLFVARARFSSPRLTGAV